MERLDRSYSCFLFSWNLSHFGTINPLHTLDGAQRKLDQT
jgi:hypothetical protein